MTFRFRTILLTFGLAVVTTIPVAGFGQAKSAVTTPAAVPSKIAFVNMQQAVTSCNEGKQESAAMQQHFSGKQAALKAQDDELKKLKDDFQINGPKLNDEERSTRQRTIQDKQKVFERDVSDYQSEAQEAQQQAIDRIVKKMLPVLEKYLMEHGFTAAIDISNPQIPVIWASKDSVITQQLVEAYNAQGPAASPATPPKPSGAGTPKR